MNRLTDDETFETMQQGLDDRDNIVWLPRVACYWGGFSLLEATLVGIESILASGNPPDYAMLLSGQDYPLRSAGRDRGLSRGSARPQLPPPLPSARRGVGR